jgi:hypothetical protein
MRFGVFSFWQTQAGRWPHDRARTGSCSVALDCSWATGTAKQDSAGVSAGSVALGCPRSRARAETCAQAAGASAALAFLALVLVWRTADASRALVASLPYQERASVGKQVEPRLLRATHPTSASGFTTSPEPLYHRGAGVRRIAPFEFVASVRLHKGMSARPAHIQQRLQAAPTHKTCATTADSGRAGCRVSIHAACTGPCTLTLLVGERLERREL